jgi:hypothetical protein
LQYENSKDGKSKKHYLKSEVELTSLIDFEFLKSVMVRGFIEDQSAKEFAQGMQ